MKLYIIIYYAASSAIILASRAAFEDEESFSTASSVATFADKSWTAFNKNGIKRVQKMANKNGSEIKIAAILIGSKIGTNDNPAKNTTGITKNGNIFGSILFIEKI